MRIIPVIDILGGIAVQAKRGERETYRPLRSRICDGADPVDVAAAFKSLGFGELYVADLDAIMGRGDNLSLLTAIARRSGMRLMVDAGISDIPRAGRVIEAGASKIIVGTETLRGLGSLAGIVDAFRGDGVIVSIDIVKGKVLSRSAEVRRLSPVTLARKLEEMGVSELIVLELSRVGSNLGADVVLGGKVAREVTIPVIVGGGVRDAFDVLEISRAGVAGVLVATALHNGRIAGKDLERLLRDK
ncbi:TPA: phosphoribosylformimino-5-aminoimidazole carboxamide ribotide isomerase [Candidatus Bathyarchaeota archaeon]|nr:phosphoribosylformimino-5-aminoimidazole carboxamide ribotide isomerase [Candidatus Bathyarchaeota archaeon]